MSDKAQHAIKSATEKLVADLQQGKSEALTNYLKQMSRFHNYSFYNTMLITTQKPNATLCAGFQTWKKAGRYVKKGEKGIAILAPIVGKVKAGDQPILSSDGKDVVRCFGFRVVYVFDHSQTDGMPLPQFAKATGPIAGQYIPHMQQAIADAGITLEYDNSILPARGMSYGGKIRVVSGMTDAEHLTVLAHEFAHEMLHKADKRERTDKRVRETEAEAVAFVVGYACGLDMGTASADYIGLYDGDADLLVESLKYVQEAAKQILDAILPDDRKPVANAA